MSSDQQREARVIECYEELSQTSREMLEAARRAEWQAVMSGQKRCEKFIAELKELGDLRPTDPKRRERKVELIRTVLADDAQIRALAEPRLERISQMLAGSRSAHKAVRTYGAMQRY